MKVVSLNVGKPEPLTFEGKRFISSINRKPATRAVMLEPLGFDGDRPGDERVHGGPDKAVCCYSHEHYPYFSRKLGTALDVPAFGENLTTEGMLESEVCLGDVYQIGRAAVQVSQPRQPCGTLAARNRSKQLPKWINEMAWGGFYFRVLEPGMVSPGDEITRLRRIHPGITIELLCRTLHDKQAPRERLVELVALPALSHSWRDKFERRIRVIDGLESDPR